jgi:hypothetical protein
MEPISDKDLEIINSIAHYLQTPTAEKRAEMAEHGLCWDNDVDGWSRIAGEVK